MTETPAKTSYFRRTRARNERQWASFEAWLDRVLGKGAPFQLSKKQQDFIFFTIPLTLLLATCIYAWWLPDAFRSFFRFREEFGGIFALADMSEPFFVNPIFIWSLVVASIISVIASLVIIFCLLARKKSGWRGALLIALCIIVQSILHNILIGVGLGVLIIYLLAQIRTHYT